MNPVIAGHRCTLRVLVSAAMAMAALAAPPAQASRPVPRTITGCVTNGVLTSDDGYRISPMQKNHQPMPLAAYNGKRISAAGELLPGDHFYPNQAWKVLGPCKKR